MRREGERKIKKKRRTPFKVEEQSRQAECFRMRQDWNLGVKKCREFLFNLKNYSGPERDGMMRITIINIY